MEERMPVGIRLVFVRVFRKRWHGRRHKKIYTLNTMRKAVITLNVVDKNGEKSLCNMVESLEVTFNRLDGRITDLLRKGYSISGNIIVNFVEEE